MLTWAAEELRFADLGDIRRNRRLMKIVEDLAAQPNASVPEASGDWAATKAAYEFWKSPRISADSIRTAAEKSTIERIRSHKIVLAIQDTTQLDLDHHPGTSGLGPTSHPEILGLMVHSTMAATPEGVPLGILDQIVWAREPDTVGKRHTRRQRDIQDKESQRWLTALATTQALVPQEVTVVTVADREADIYDLFVAPRPANAHLLIRVDHNRKVDHEAQYLQEAMRQVAPCGQLTLELQATEHRSARTATLTVRFATLAVQPPRHHPQRAKLKPVLVQFVLVEEENPPKGETPIHWLLLTTLPVTSFSDALGCVRSYTYRWLIERYHYVLKSGCRIEQLQLETASRLEKALATYSIVAWRLLWLTYQARVHPDTPCDTILEAHEWQSLYCTIHHTTTPPAQPPSLHQAVRWIAKLGGFLGRKSDKEPGVKTIWRGMRRLHDIAKTWQLIYSGS